MSKYNWQIRIRDYKPKNVYKRKRMVSRLLKLTGHIGDGWYDSAMFRDLNVRRDGRMFLAWKGNKIIGWAFVTEGYDYHLQVGVYVHVKYRRRGVGSMLTQKALEYARQNNRQLIAEGDEDTSGEFLYKKNGLKWAPYKWELL